MLTPGRTLAASLLLSLLAPASAQSLGAARGDLWIGRPLEVTVPARFSGDDRNECVQADVFYGDAKVPAGRVRATVLGPDDQRRVRITADPAIDEPMVTVTLRAGCRDTISRTYTLLPGMLSQPALAAAAARSAGAPPAAVSSPVRVAAPARIAPAARARAPETRQRPPRQRSLARAERPREPSGTPRLRLDMWEPELPAQAMLRVSANLTPPSQDAAQRAAAALLWQAINADPSELLRTSATLARLEGELAQLRSTAQQTRAEMAALRRVLEQPQPALLSGAVAQGLLLLLLAGGAAGAFLWYRNARQLPLVGAWSGQRLDPAPDLAPDSELPPPDAAQPALELPPEPGPESVAAPLAAPVALQPVTAAASVGPIDFDLEPRRPAAAVPGPLRVETLAATFQEVEFLASLGLWEDATDALKAYLEDSAAPAPIAFFELMRLYAHHEDMAAVAAVRRRYAQVIGSEAPAMAQINGPFGLQSRTELSSRITRHWGKPQVLSVIEDMLFAVPAPERALSLEAGRDLLCLYQVALELQRAPQSAAGGGEDAQDHALAPWAQATDVQAAAQAAADASGGLGFALDLDLSAPAGALAVSLPEPQAPQEDDADAEVDPLLAEFEALAGPGSVHKPQPPTADSDEDAFSAAVALESRRPLPR